MKPFLRFEGGRGAFFIDGVSRYKQTNDRTALGEVPEQIKEKYADSEWALKASVWSQ